MAASTTAFDERQQRDEPIGHPAEIHPHDPVVVGVTRFVRWSEDADPGIVDENVEPPEMRVDLFRDLGEARAIGHVELQEKRGFVSGIREPACRLGAVCLVAIR